MSAPSIDDLRGALRVLKALQPGSAYFYGDSATRQVLDQVRQRMSTLTKVPKKASKSTTVEVTQTCGLQKLRKLRKASAGTVHRLIESARPDVKMILPASVHEVTEDDDVPKVLPKHMRCYDCRKMFTRVHSFYDQMCVPCGDKNYAKRMQEVPLQDGQVSLVTGSRVKIGYKIALKLLRAPNGGKVVITTRFPKDAAARYSLEEDYDLWKHKLVIVGLDFRDVASVEKFGRWVCETFDRLDVLINNAAQTIRRPPSYYTHLMEKERNEEITWPTVLNPGVSADMSQIPMMESDEMLMIKSHLGRSLFPVGHYDVDGQQIDERASTTWTSKLGDVETVELMETLCINSAAPFILMRVLKPLMARGDSSSFVINVSSMEGDFNRHNKMQTHPHTNGAKAFLDMITRTSSADYVQSDIYMNSVDTGWVNIETPRAHHKPELVPPIDEVDGAARVLAPIVTALTTGEHAFGKFFKDYRVCETMLPDVHLQA